MFEVKRFGGGLHSLAVYVTTDRSTPEHYRREGKVGHKELPLVRQLDVVLSELGCGYS